MEFAEKQPQGNCHSSGCGDIRSREMAVPDMKEMYCQEGRATPAQEAHPEAAPIPLSSKEPYGKHAEHSTNSGQESYPHMEGKGIVRIAAPKLLGRLTSAHQEVEAFHEKRQIDHPAGFFEGAGMSPVSCGVDGSIEEPVLIGMDHERFPKPEPRQPQKSCCEEDDPKENAVVTSHGALMHVSHHLEFTHIFSRKMDLLAAPLTRALVLH